MKIYKVTIKLLILDFRYAMWINPNPKAGFRHKPIEFGNSGIWCDVPRNLIANQLIMKAAWMSYDNLTDNNSYFKDIVIGGVLDIECLEYPA